MKIKGGTPLHPSQEGNGEGFRTSPDKSGAFYWTSRNDRKKVLKWILIIKSHQRGCFQVNDDYGNTYGLINKENGGV
jgi:hypothetical protein